MPFEKCHFTSAMQQKVMFLCFENGNKITYKEQDIYTNERSFEIAISELIKQKIMQEKKIREYHLTYNGLFYVKNIILK